MASQIHSNVNYQKNKLNTINRAQEKVVPFNIILRDLLKTNKAQSCAGRIIEKLNKQIRRRNEGKQ